MNAFITVFTTVTAGVLVYVLGQAAQQFVLKTLADFNNVKLDISHRLKFHTNIYVNHIPAGPIRDRASEDARDMACNLESKYLAIPFRKLFVGLRWLPKGSDVNDAVGRLIRLSNSTGETGRGVSNHEDIEEIKNLLSIRLS